MIQKDLMDMNEKDILDSMSSEELDEIANTLPDLIKDYKIVLAALIKITAIRGRTTIYKQAYQEKIMSAFKRLCPSPYPLNPHAGDKALIAELVKALGICLQQMQLEDMIFPEEPHLKSAIAVARATLEKAKAGAA